MKRIYLLLILAGAFALPAHADLSEKWKNAEWRKNRDNFHCTNHFKKAQFELTHPFARIGGVRRAFIGKDNVLYVAVNTGRYDQNLRGGFVCKYSNIPGYYHGKKVGKEFVYDAPLAGSGGRYYRETVLLKIEGNVINEYTHSKEFGYKKILCLSI